MKLGFHEFADLTKVGVIEKYLLLAKYQRR